METSAMKVVKSRPLSYMNLKTKLKYFLEQLSYLIYVIISLFEKIRQSEAVTGTTIPILNKIRTESNMSLFYWHP